MANKGSGCLLTIYLLPTFTVVVISDMDVLDKLNRQHRRLLVIVTHSGNSLWLKVELSCLIRHFNNFGSVNKPQLYCSSIGKHL